MEEKDQGWRCVILADAHSAQPSPTHLPTHNGRLRPRGPHPLLPPLRHLPALLRKSALRLHIRSRPRRIPVPAHNLLPHVPTARRQFSDLNAFVRPTHTRPHERGRRHGRRWAAVEYVDVPTECQCIGLLSASTCPYEFRGSDITDGYGGRVCD